MNCADVEELRDLYALGALGPEEAEGVEEHMAGCAECSQRIAGSWRAAQLLRHAVPAREPRASARLRMIDAAVRDPTESAASIPVTGLGFGGDSRVSAAPLAAAPGRVTPSAAAPGRPRLRFSGGWGNLRWAAATALVPLLVSAWLANQVVVLQGQVQRNERALVQSWQNAQHAAEVMGKAIEGDGTMATLTGTEMAPTANGTLYYLPGERDSVLVVAGLPQLEPGRVYQLWLVREDEERRSGGTFYLEEDGRGMLVVKSPWNMRVVRSVRVTNEPRGGSAEPQGKGYMWANLEGASPRSG